MLENLRREVTSATEHGLVARLGLALERAESHVERRELSYGVIFVFFVALAGVALAVQGWRSRIPTFDLLTYIRSVHDLLASGALPRYGDLSSGGAFSPPGT